MAEPRFDVCGIGNAIVDVLAHADDAFLVRHGLVKGTMRLIDAEAALSYYRAMGPAIESSGGSAANTIAALASLGAQAAFIGKVRDDELGRFFRHDIRALGVRFDTASARDGAATARCLIVVTPDAQRTMQTYLGASSDFSSADVDEKLIGEARVTYLEGYLWDKPKAKAAFRQAAEAAHRAGRLVALSLSDPFCVERHRDDFLDLVHGHVDILFANEHEIMALYRAPTFDAALQPVLGRRTIAALTRSEKGSVVAAGGEVHVVDAEPVAKVVDTTGAGDAYAAGFLSGFCRGRDLALCARIGAIAAAEVIGHMGARPEASLEELVAQKLG